MGDKKVPFGHAGFDARIKKYPFKYRTAAENVAMNHGMADVAKVPFTSNPLPIIILGCC